MDGIWYYRCSGKLTGPIQFRDLVEAAANGAFAADDDVRSGHGGWQKARTVPELSVVLGVSVEESANPNDGPDSELDDLPQIDDFFIDSESLPADASNHQVAAAAAVAFEKKTQYLCRIDGKERGPLTLASLQKLVDAGEIPLHEQVRRTDSAVWVPCREISELDFDRVSTIPDGSSDPNESFDDDNFDPHLLDRFEDSDPMQSILDESEENSPAPSEASSRIAAVSPPPARTSEPPPPQRRESAAEPVRKPPVADARPNPMLGIDVPPPPVEKATKPKKTRGGFSFSPSEVVGTKGQLIFLGLAVLFFVYMYAIPPSKSGVYGTVKMGEQLLPVGTVTLKTDSSVEHALMTLSIFDGEFSSGEEMSLSPVKYQVIVTIGNPLGMPVPQLNGTAFEKMNGAKFRTELNPALLESDSIEIVIDESSVKLLEGTGELPATGTPR